MRDDGSELVIHAMKMRPKYRRLLRETDDGEEEAYGRTASGKPITDELVEKLADKAEAG